MKITIKAFNAILLVVMSALLAWLTELTTDFADGRLPLFICSFLTYAFTSCLAYGIKYDAERSGLMARVLANAALIVFLVLNFVFALLSSFSLPAYIITTGVLLIIFLLWWRWVVSTDQ